MSLERTFSDDGTELRILVGEKFDFSKVHDFRMAYSKDSDAVTAIVIDLKHTNYMDSSALGMLLNMQKTMSAKVSTFSIINRNEQVAKILQIARFEKKFTLS